MPSFPQNPATPSLKKKGGLKTKLANASLLFLSVLVCLILLEIALRGELIDRFYRSRSYDVNGYEFHYHVNLNSRFFRDEEFQKEKKEGTFRIFLIGDSFVFGTGVDQDQTIDKLLEQKLNQGSTPRFEVYNLGQPAASPREYYQIAQRFRDYQPDLVILSFYVDNDVRESEWTKSFKVLDLRLEIENRLNFFLWKLGLRHCLFSWVEHFQFDPFYKEKMCRGEINPFLAYRLEEPEIHESYRQKVALFESTEETKAKILAIRSLFPNTPFYLLIQPSKYQVSESYFEPFEKLGLALNSLQLVGRDLQDSLIRWANSQKIEAWDVLPEMLQEKDRSFYHLIDDHYNAAGDQFVADFLYKKLKDSQKIAGTNR